MPPHDVDHPIECRRDRRRVGDVERHADDAARVGGAQHLDQQIEGSARQIGGRDERASPKQALADAGADGAGGAGDQRDLALERSRRKRGARQAPPARGGRRSRPS